MASQSENGLKSPRPKQGPSSPRPQLTQKQSSENGTAKDKQTLLDLGPLEPFLKPDFDVTSFTRETLTGSDRPDATVRKLRRHLETVEHAISTHVAMHEDSLVGTLEAVGSLKREMTRGKSDSNALLVSLTRVENDFREPFERLKTTSQSLKNAHEATGVLRKLGWFLMARKKLKAALEESNQNGANGAAGKDASKAAQLIAELEELLNDGSLKGVTIVDSEAKWIKEVGAKVRQDAQKALEKAIVSLNQGEMGLALQAFFHLNILEDRVSYATIWAAKEFAQEAREALRDVNASSAASDQVQRLQVLRSRTDGMLERSLRSWAVRVWNLQRVLTKKRDPTTHTLFANVVKIEVFDQFWNRATAALEQELKTCARWVREAMVDDYARLRRSARAMLVRLWTSTSSVSTGSAQNPALARKLAVGGPRETQALMQAFHPFLSEFLGQCLARLNQPVMVMFPEEEVRGLRHVEPRLRSIPTANDVQTFAQIIGKELQAVKGDAELTAAVAKTCAMSISLFYEKAQALVSKADPSHTFRLIAPELTFSTSSASAMPVSSTARTAVQEHNVNILVLVSQLVIKLREIIDSVANPSKTGPDGQTNAFDDVNGLVSGEGAVVEEEDDDDTDFAIGEDDDGENAHESQPNAPTREKPSASQPPQSLVVRLESARAQLEQLIAEILHDYIGSEQCLKVLDDVLMDINAENYNTTQDSNTTRSYTAKFSKACKTLKEEHLNKLPQSDITCIETCQHMVQRVVNRIGMRASLVRPLSQSGRQALVRDCRALIDSTLTLFVGTKQAPSIEKFARSLFDGLERLILAKNTPAELVKSGVVTKVLAWHHLFADAPTDVHSPFTKVGRSVAAYLVEVEGTTDMTKTWSIIESCIIGKPDSVRRPFEELRSL